jgi:hypothetical protein
MLTLNILANEKRREALCVSCAHEVTNKGFKGEVLTFCGYGGGLRELKFQVCECTVYTDKRIPRPEKPIGFVKPGEKARPRLTIIKIA